MNLFKRRENSTSSYKGIIWLVWSIIFVLLLGLYAILQRIVLGNTLANAEKSIKAEITTCEQGIDDVMTMIDKYLYEEYYVDSTNSISSLLYLCKTGDTLDKVIAKKSLNNVVTGVCSWSDQIAFSMLFMEGEDENICFESGKAQTYALRQTIRNELESGENRHAIKNQYMVIRDGRKGYLLRIMKLEKTFFVIGLSEDKFIETMKPTLFSEKSIIFAIDSDEKVFFCTEPKLLDEGLLRLENDGNYIDVDGEIYFQTGSMSNRSGIYFGVLTDRASIEGSFAYVKYSFYGIFAVLAVLLSVINAMVGRIQNLKIESYEAKFETQKATMEMQKASMQYLQTQIKPHFYANALNIIYSLAETRDFETIQKLSKAIVNFSRYKFHDATELVELSKELEHVEYFMEIQKIRYSYQVELTIDVPNEVMSALIPPFVIQNFVENSTKYAFSSKKFNMVNISATRATESDSLVISISDNGDGYPDNMIDGSFKNMNIEGHIGLKNVLKRMSLIYEEGADIELTNEGGAVATITIPYISTDIVDLDDI